MRTLDPYCVGIRSIWHKRTEDHHGSSITRTTRTGLAKPLIPPRLPQCNRRQFNKGVWHDVSASWQKLTCKPAAALHQLSRDGAQPSARRCITSVERPRASSSPFARASARPHGDDVADPDNHQRYCCSKEMPRQAHCDRIESDNLGVDYAPHGARPVALVLRDWPQPKASFLQSPTPTGCGEASSYCRMEAPPSEPNAPGQEVRISRDIMSLCTTIPA